MADSKNENSSENFADDLDAILNKAEISEKQDNSIDDDDVIDRLLMDDQLSEDQQIESTLEETGSNKIAKKEQKENNADEFEADDLINSIPAEKELEYDEFADEDEFNVDDLLNSVDKETKDEFSEAESVDPIVEDTVFEKTQSEGADDGVDKEDLIEPETMDEGGGSDNKDDLMTNFDISADDDEMYELDENEKALLDLGEQSTEQEVELDNTVEKIEAVAADFQNKLDAQSVITTQTTEDITQANATINELNTRVNQLLTDNDGLSELISVLTATTTAKDASAADEIDTLQKEQRKLRKTLKEGESKVPLITYVVMGVATLALLVAGILGAIGYGAKTDVENLTELVATLEEEIEIITARDSTKSDQKVNSKINALQLNDQGFSEQLAEVNKKIQQPNDLKTVIDDLVVQNDHAQKAIEKLLATVEVLEQQKSIVRTKKKAKKLIAKVEWVVNLVSFKQEWYAKRKAKEFEKKGIPAKVEQVKIKGKQWFRLRVKGFKSKYEAAAYAVKVKKTLNLSSVWVTKA